MKIAALAAMLLALLVPATGLAAGADVTPNRSCSWNGYEGLAVTVEHPGAVYVTVCRVTIPGVPGQVVIVVHGKA